jgi:hypothetical protein
MLKNGHDHLTKEMSGIGAALPTLGAGHGKGTSVRDAISVVEGQESQLPREHGDRKNHNQNGLTLPNLEDAQNRSHRKAAWSVLLH